MIHMVLHVAYTFSLLWAGHLESMEEIHTKFQTVDLKGKDNFGRTKRRLRIVTKRILMICCVNMWTGFKKISIGLSGDIL